MKRIQRILSLMVVFIATGITLASAQQGKPRTPVVPGEKGTLPVFTLPAKAGGNTFTALWISKVDGYTGLFGDKNIVTDLSWPDPVEFGGDSFTLQMEQGGTWKDYDTFDGRSVGAQIDVSTATRFRLRMNGGEKDGWLSNVVTAIAPTLYSEFRNSSLSNADKQDALVGVEYGKSLVLNVESYVGKDGKETEEKVTYTIADGVYRYSWYRRNPNTWEMTAIDGATKPTYTATLNDIGYELVLIVSGDNTHCGFSISFVMGGYSEKECIVSIPIAYDFEYMGNDGFVLNTNYILPEGCGLTLNSYSRELFDWVTTTYNNVKVRKPGQYELRVGSEIYENAELGLTIPGLVFGNPQDMPNLDPDTGEPIEGTYLFITSQIFTYEYQQPLTVNATFDGRPIDTTVELITQNLDGELVTATMQSTRDGVASFYVFPNEYYIKVRGEKDTSDTFYPSVASIDEATAVKPGTDDTMQPVTVSVSMIPDNTYIEDRFVIEPGSDGELPALPVFEKKDGRFGGFGVRRPYFDTLDKIWIVEFEIPWRNIAGRGDGVVTMQCRASENDEWGTPSTYLNSGGVPQEVRLGDALKMTYRLLITGGPMDGWVSNTVSVTRPNKQLNVRFTYSQPLFIGLNYTVDAQNLYDATLFQNGQKQTLNRNQLMTNHSWYRRNPETGEATLIEGASKSTYVPQMADVGYELISVVEGDPNGYYYYDSYNQGIVMMPILCSVAYAGEDGLLLNTNYVLHEPEKSLWINRDDMWGGHPGDEGYNQYPFDEGVVKTVKPGQYAIRINIDDEAIFFKQIGYSDEPYILCRRNPRWWSYRQFFISEAETQSFPVPFVVKKDGACLKDVPIDVIGENIEGDLTVLKTFSPEAGKDTVTVEMRQGSYYFLTHKTDKIAATYYPGVLKQADATRLYYTEELQWTLSELGDENAIVIEAQEPVEEVEGDTDGDGNVNADDVLTVTQTIFSGVPNPQADVNKDGKVDIADIITIVKLLFSK